MKAGSLSIDSNLAYVRDVGQEVVSFLLSVYV
jgi:hypothetical protein